MTLKMGERVFVKRFSNTGTSTSNCVYQRRVWGVRHISPGHRTHASVTLYNKLQVTNDKTISLFTSQPLLEY